jgi:hypothetical protein
MLWLLGIRLRKRRCGGGPKIRVRRSQAGSCSVIVLGCLLSGSALVGDVGDRGRCQGDDMDGQEEQVEGGKRDGKRVWSGPVQAPSYISQIDGNHRDLGSHRSHRGPAMVERASPEGTKGNKHVHPIAHGISSSRCVDCIEKSNRPARTRRTGQRTPSAQTRKGRHSCVHTGICAPAPSLVTKAR